MRLTVSLPIRCCGVLGTLLAGVLIGHAASVPPAERPAPVPTSPPPAVTLPGGPAPVDPAPISLSIPSVSLNDWVLIKSEFDDSFQTGKDPFFPGSTRIRGSLIATNKQALLEWPDLRLAGISAASSQRLALVNKYTFAAGETQEVKVKDQTYEIQCVEIRERSVVLSWRGEKREFSLRSEL